MKKQYRLYWSPEGRPIAIVKAESIAAAIKKTPKPYKEYLGEIYAELDNPIEPIGYYVPYIE